MTIFGKDKTYVAGTYNRFPVAIKSGKGSILTGEDGREYIDLTSGIGVTQPKDKDRLNGYQYKTPIYAVYKRPTSKQETHTD